MKSLSDISILVIAISLLVISCKPDNNPLPADPEFSLKFENGMIIDEKDIVFYDSSSCNLLLKNKLQFNYLTKGTSGYEFSKFSVHVDNDTVYKGIVYSSFAAEVPETPYIESDLYLDFDSDIIPLRYHRRFTSPEDKRNDPRIISAFERSNLLKQGISCKVDSIYKSSENDSSVVCVFTLENHDDINYYLPDPNKMGYLNFSSCVMGLNLINKNTSEQISFNFGQTGGNPVLNESGISLLKSKSKITFTYASKYEMAINKDLYRCNFNYSYYGGYSVIKIPLAQNDGRVWVGDIHILNLNISERKK